MPSVVPLAVVVVASGAGAALGWWVLSEWTRRSLIRDVERMSARALRAWCAVSAAVVFGVLAWRFGASYTFWALAVFAAASVVLSMVDVLEHRLPNAVLLPTLVVVLLLITAPALFTARPGPVIGALVGAAAMFVAYLVVALIAPTAMGIGDVKLAALIGLVLGWFGLTAWVIGLFAAFVIGGAVALGAIASRRVTLRGSIPFGPSMLAGALAAVVLVGR